MINCCFCNCELEDRDSHNAQPVMNGRCCSTCNPRIVLRARMFGAEVIAVHGYSIEELIDEINYHVNLGWTFGNSIFRNGLDEIYVAYLANEGGVKRER